MERLLRSVLTEFDGKFPARGDKKEYKQEAKFVLKALEERGYKIVWMGDD